MCVKRKFDPRTRKIYMAANLCLLAGLLPSILDLHVRAYNPLFQVARFTLLIAAIVLFLWVMRLRKRSGPRPGRQA